MVYVWQRLVTLCLPDFTLPIESWWKSALSIWSWQSSWKLVSYDVPRWLNLRIVFRIPTELDGDRKHRIESFGDLVSDTPAACLHQWRLATRHLSECQTGYSMLFCNSFPFCPTSVRCCKYSRNPISRNCQSQNHRSLLPMSHIFI